MAKKKTETPSNGSPAPVRAASRRRSAGGSAPRSVAANGDSRSMPSHDEIAEAAYRRYLSRGGQHGRDFDDWLEAEHELRTRTTQ